MKKLRKKTPVQDQVEEIQGPVTLTLDQVKEAEGRVRERMSYDIPGIPPVKPPPVKQGEGSALLNDDTGTVILVLDRGSFMYLWAKMEVYAKDDHSRFRNVVGSGVERCSRTSLGLIRQAAIDAGIVTAPAGPAPKKKLRKKVAA